MRRKILLLLNNAPDVKIFTNDLYKRLENEGFDVIVASESLFYQYTLNLDFSVDYIFSQYFKLNKDKYDLKLLNTSIANFNIWESYFSDYDRANHIGNKHTKDYTNKVMVCLYNFFYEIFEREKIDIVWHEAVSNSFNYAAYNISTLFNAKYKGLIYSRLPNRYEVLNAVYADSRQYIEEYNNALYNADILDEKAVEYIDKYLLNFSNIQPDYMQLVGLNATDSMAQLYLRKDKIRYLIKSLIYLKKERKNDVPYAYQLGNPIVSSINTFWMQLKRKIKLPIIIKKYYEPIDNSLNDLFFLYPLHFHPESATSIWARHLNDELNTIINIAFNLPFGYKLYVKDHISAAGFPSLSFYKKLSQIPNVVIIPFSQDAKILIKRCVKVITLTSTVGFEALVLGKPVIVLGKVFYEKHPLVTKIDNFEQLFKILSQSSRDTIANSNNAVSTVYGYYKISMSIDDYKDTIDLIIDSIKK
ncbi:hypothetical protein GCM10011514_30650 [Emticicia aquatilis]|uniref:Capsule polysaccharide biosynthesis protein n=1 Tax=Emticicia aquatilis TaxID=1537369 RepID=A0A916YWG4_9BACT|nr:hypothetical protein [Emticicia aquatilis]GGD64524.1 hypothetical protein GCM10011514_30650 [Emticicia aquatilis]